jgi:hypothetical protein
VVGSPGAAADPVAHRCQDDLAGPTTGGLTGQIDQARTHYWHHGSDGSYLAELLLRRGYEVHGLIRRARIRHRAAITFYVHPPEPGPGLFLHYADLSDRSGRRP